MGRGRPRWWSPSPKRMRRRNRRIIPYESPRARRPRFFTLQDNGTNEIGWAEFRLLWVPEGSSYTEFDPVLVTGISPNGDPLWPTTGDPGEIKLADGTPCTEILFGNDGVSPEPPGPPFYLFLTLQLVFGPDPLPGGPGDVLVPANCEAVRGPYGEWLAPGVYDFGGSPARMSRAPETPAHN